MSHFPKAAALALAAAAGLSVPHPAVAAPVQWLVADGGNDHWYEYVTTAVSWTRARSNALASVFRGENGYLATVLSAEEYDFLGGLTGNVNAWLGGSDANVEGTWIWVDGPEAGEVFWQNGTSIGYSNWRVFEPSNGGRGEDYLMGWWISGKWNDSDGGTPIGYVVEYENNPTYVPAPAAAGLLTSGLLTLGLLRRRRAAAAGAGTTCPGP